MATTGTNGITAIDPNVAINREGLIAFTGRDTNGSRPFAVFKPFQIVPLGITGSTRTYAGVGISAGQNAQAIARELVTGPSYIVREWNVNTGAGTILGSSVNSSGPADFDSASSMLDVNDQGVAAVAALVNGSTTTVLLIGATRPMLQSASYQGAVALRPQIANNGEVVVRDNLGRVITITTSGPNYIAASTANFFGTDTGNRPGISADATAIAFTGNRGNGPGVYAAVRLPSDAPQMITVAGAELADGFTNFISEQRVGVVASHWADFDIFNFVFEGVLNGVDGVYTRQLVLTNGSPSYLGPPLALVHNGDTLAGSTVTGFTLYKPINFQGQIAFSVQLANGVTAIVSQLPVQYGIDVSHYQGVIDWVKVLRAGKTFAFIKATQGTNYTDPTFAFNSLFSHLAGILTGAYHFATPLDNPGTQGAIAEANYFLSQAGSQLGPGHLPPVLDIESQTNDNNYPTNCEIASELPKHIIDLTCYYKGTTALSDWVRAWVTTVQQQAHVNPIIYASGSYAQALAADLSAYNLWVATDKENPQYNPSNLGPWGTNWTFQQYSKTGTVDGINGNVDLDSFKGTLTDLGLLVGGGVPPVVFTGTDGSPLTPPQNGKFTLRIASPITQDITIQATSDFRSWLDLQTITMQNSEGSFTDANAGINSVRFYRAKQ
jgi:lysozyme